MSNNRRVINLCFDLPEDFTLKLKAWLHSLEVAPRHVKFTAMIPLAAGRYPSDIEKIRARFFEDFSTFHISCCFDDLVLLNRAKSGDSSSNYLSLPKYYPVPKVRAISLDGVTVWCKGDDYIRVKTRLDHFSLSGCRLRCCNREDDDGRLEPLSFREKIQNNMREAIDGGELCIAFREPMYETDYDEYQLVDTDNEDLDFKQNTDLRNFNEVIKDGLIKKDRTGQTIAFLSQSTVISKTDKQTYGSRSRPPTASYRPADGAGMPDMTSQTVNNDADNTQQDPDYDPASTTRGMDNDNDSHDATEVISTQEVIDIVNETMAGTEHRLGEMISRGISDGLQALSSANVAGRGQPSPAIAQPPGGLTMAQAQSALWMQGWRMQAPSGSNQLNWQVGSQAAGGPGGQAAGGPGGQAAGGPGGQARGQGRQIASGQGVPVPGGQGSQIGAQQNVPSIVQVGQQPGVGNQARTQNTSQSNSQNNQSGARNGPVETVINIDPPEPVRETGTRPRDNNNATDQQQRNLQRAIVDRIDIYNQEGLAGLGNNRPGPGTGAGGSLTSQPPSQPSSPSSRPASEGSAGDDRRRATNRFSDLSTFRVQRTPGVRNTGLPLRYTSTPNINANVRFNIPDDRNDETQIPQTDGNGSPASMTSQSVVQEADMTDIVPQDMEMDINETRGARPIGFYGLDPIDDLDSSQAEDDGGPTNVRGQRSEMVQVTPDVKEEGTETVEYQDIYIDLDIGFFLTSLDKGDDLRVAWSNVNKYDLYVTNDYVTIIIPKEDENQEPENESRLSERIFAQPESTFSEDVLFSHLIQHVNFVHTRDDVGVPVENTMPEHRVILYDINHVHRDDSFEIRYMPDNITLTAFWSNKCMSELITMASRVESTRFIAHQYTGYRVPGTEGLIPSQELLTYLTSLSPAEHDARVKFITLLCKIGRLVELFHFDLRWRRQGDLFIREGQLRTRKVRLQLNDRNEVNHQIFENQIAGGMDQYEESNYGSQALTLGLRPLGEISPDQSEDGDRQDGAVQITRLDNTQAQDDTSMWSTILSTPANVGGRLIGTMGHLLQQVPRLRGFDQTTNEGINASENDDQLNS